MQRPRASRELFPEWAPTIVAFLLASFVVAVLSACADDPSTPQIDPTGVAAVRSHGATFSGDLIPGVWIASAPDGTEVAGAESLTNAYSNEVTVRF